MDTTKYTVFGKNLASRADFGESTVKNGVSWLIFTFNSEDISVSGLCSKWVKRLNFGNEIGVDELIIPNKAGFKLQPHVLIYRMALLSN